jgi:predicted  nucleic acid-binding Zn-ribbon protein
MTTKERSHLESMRYGFNKEIQRVREQIQSHKEKVAILEKELAEHIQDLFDVNIKLGSDSWDAK